MKASFLVRITTSPLGTTAVDDRIASCGCHSEATPTIVEATDIREIAIRAVPSLTKPAQTKSPMVRRHEPIVSRFSGEYLWVGTSASLRFLLSGLAGAEETFVWTASLPLSMSLVAGVLTVV